MKVFILLSFILVSCTSTPKNAAEQTNSTGEEAQPPPEVSVVFLDSASRPPSDSVRVYTDRTAVDRRYVEIAVLTVRGRSEQALIDQLKRKSQELGADAVILTDNEVKAVAGIELKSMYIPVRVRVVKAVAVIYERGTNN